MATFVIVHGAHDGGWFWRDVRLALEACGHTAYTPTLTGLGERVHLAHADIDLETHIMDVANVIKYERLKDVVLVGHSYGGAVITGVAERIPERLARLVYLDGYVLEDGQAFKDLLDRELVEMTVEVVNALGDGWRLPFTREPYDDRVTDHPMKTFTQPLSVKSKAAKGLPRTFIYCTEKDPAFEPLDVPLRRAAAKAREQGWDYYELPTGHNMCLTMPKETAELLVKAASGS